MRKAMALLHQRELFMVIERRRAPLRLRPRRNQPRRWKRWKRLHHRLPRFLYLRRWRLATPGMIGKQAMKKTREITTHQVLKIVGTPVVTKRRPNPRNKPVKVGV